MKWIASFLAAITLTLCSVALVWAQTDSEKMQALTKQIEEYTRQIKELQSKANTLANQVAQFDAQIRLTELKIDQTQEQIVLLGGRIDQLEISLSSLAKAFSSRAVETYRMSRLAQDTAFLLSAPDMSKAVSRFQYLRRVQEADRNLLARLQGAQDTYKNQKGELEALEEELGKQKSALDSQKAAKTNLLQVTKNDEKKYQQLLSEAQAQLSAFRRFISSQGGATILSNQTKCDGWGCYYNQRDSQWGNYRMGSSDSSMAEYGCLVTSMAMVASHYGKSVKPGDIAMTSSVFFGNTAYMNMGTWAAGGTTMTRTRVCTSCGVDTIKQKMNEELSAGRPVVIGLFSGPDHFIVIKEKQGDNYVMHDPFLENGGNRPLGDKYTVNDIKTVDVVRVN